MDEAEGLTDLIFYELDIAEAIDEISETAAAGPDGVAAIFLKKCKLAFCKPLYILYRDSLDAGFLCENPKNSCIVPLHKGDSRGLPANYRPVSLTSHLVKIMEKVIRKGIVKYLEENGLFNPNQHGFCAGKSCLSQLLEYYDTILRLVGDGYSVDTVYLDFSKAFDKVDHSILLSKLKGIGIGGKLGRWIHSFLTDRKQVVTVNGITSKSAPVKSGVPQGTVLGPILFLIYIADIDGDIKYSSLSSFADDTRLLKAIQTVMDTFELQHDLNMAYTWTNDNNMTLNDTKFQLLRHGCSEVQKNSCYLSPSGTKIEEKECVKDLGVLMDNDCTFSSHINKVVEKMKEMSGWILRTFKLRSPMLMLTLWKSLVLPHHDYCSQLWSPLSVKSRQDLEMVQRKFLSKIDGMYNFTYWEQLKKLGLYSLERRRERYRVLYTWKILEGIVPNTSSTNGITAQNHARFGRLCHVPFVRRSPYQGLRNASFNVRAPMLFNCIPREVRDMKNCTKEEFKGKLNAHLKNIPDEPLIPGYVAYRRAETNSILDMSILCEIS